MRGGRSRWIPVAAGAVLVACGSLDVAELVDVELSVSDSVLALGDTLDVRVAVTNFGRVPIQIVPAGCPHLFEVRDSVDAVVGPERPFCPLGLVAPVTMEPGESYRFDYRWAGESNAEDAAHLEPGRYRLQGWALVVTADDPPRSNVATVRIHDEG